MGAAPASGGGGSLGDVLGGGASSTSSDWRLVYKRFIKRSVLLRSTRQKSTTVEIVCKSSLIFMLTLKAVGLVITIEPCSSRNYTVTVPFKRTARQSLFDHWLFHAIGVAAEVVVEHRCDSLLALVRSGAVVSKEQCPLGSVSAHT